MGTTVHFNVLSLCRRASRSSASRRTPRLRSSSSERKQVHQHLQRPWDPADHLRLVPMVTGQFQDSPGRGVTRSSLERTTRSSAQPAVPSQVTCMQVCQFYVDTSHVTFRNPSSRLQSTEQHVQSIIIARHKQERTFNQQLTGIIEFSWV